MCAAIFRIIIVKVGHKWFIEKFTSSLMSTTSKRVASNHLIQLPVWQLVTVCPNTPRSCRERLCRTYDFNHLCNGCFNVFAVIKTIHTLLNYTTDLLLSQHQETNFFCSWVIGKQLSVSYIRPCTYIPSFIHFKMLTCLVKRASSLYFSNFICVDKSFM